MKKFKINETEIEFDETKRYLDYYLDSDQGVLSQIDFNAFLESLQSGKVPADEHLKTYLEYLQRWVLDAPRKRFNRQCRLDGMTVLTTDELFTEDTGEQTINDLENTGILASYLLQTLTFKQTINKL